MLSLSKYTSLLRGRVPSAVGTLIQPQGWESLAGTRKCTPKRPETLLPAAVESASGLSSLCSVMWRLRWLGNSQTQPDAREMGWVQPRRRSSFLDSKSRSYVWRTQQTIQENLLAEKWFSSVPGARSYKIKTGGGRGAGGKSLNNSFPNSEEAISYFLSWKASWFTKTQVHVFGSDVLLVLPVNANQCLVCFLCASPISSVMLCWCQSFWIFLNRFSAQM